MGRSNEEGEERLELFEVGWGRRRIEERAAVGRRWDWGDWRRRRSDGRNWFPLFPNRFASESTLRAQLNSSRLCIFFFKLFLFLFVSKKNSYSKKENFLITTRLISQKNFKENFHRSDLVTLNLMSGPRLCGSKSSLCVPRRFFFRNILQITTTRIFFLNTCLNSYFKKMTKTFI